MWEFRCLEYSPGWANVLVTDPELGPRLWGQQRSGSILILRIHYHTSIYGSKKIRAFLAVESCMDLLILLTVFSHGFSIQVSDWKCSGLSE